MPYSRGRPFPELFTDLISQLTLLVRKEGQLARTEISEKLSRALAGMALVLVGAVLLIPALVILLQAAISGLVEGGVHPALAALIVGGAALIVGLVLALVGWSWIKPASLLPDRTIDQFQRDAAMAQRATSTATTEHGLTGKPDGQETGYGHYPDRAA